MFGPSRVPAVPDARRRVAVIIAHGRRPGGGTAVRDVDRTQMVWETDTMDALRSQSVAQRRFNVMLLGVFATVALTLAVIGIFGVVSYAVERRTRETGIRMALGASPSQILRLIIGQTMRLTAAGVAVGLAVAFGMSRLMTVCCTG